MASFKNWCGLPSTHGAINYMHIHIQKPISAFVANYFSYKSKVHIKQCKQLLIMISIFAMFLWDYQDLWMILKFCNCLIFTRMQPIMDFFDLEHGSQDGICPYILGTRVTHFYHGT
jgi:hypothetical protein